MQTITTKSTRERMIRNALVTFMLVGFSAYSFYDGYVGYPKDNLAHMRGELPAEAQAAAKYDVRIVPGLVPSIRPGESLRDVEAKLGPPAWKGKGTEDFNKAVWFGPSDTLILRYDSAGTVLLAAWKEAKHTQTDLKIQKGMGVGVGAIGLYALIRLLAMLLTSVKLSDEGLTTERGRLIGYEEMTAWDPADFRVKGRITLGYVQGGVAGTYVLDDYKVAAFKRIVEEICARKGFENPLVDQPNLADAAGTEGTEGPAR